MNSTTPPPPFEIGLIAAGAVSAGAYTAGVLDLLFEALDAMEAAQAAGEPGVPRHGVALRAVVGASAGAMNAAIVAAWSGRRFPAMSAATIGDPAATARNPFAWSWVDQADIGNLLDTGDLAGDRLPSLLNGGWLDAAVTQVLSPGATPGGLAPPAAISPRRWLSELRVRMTVGNLTGTPFPLRFDSTAQPAGGMMDHAEVMDFQAGAVPPAVPSHYQPLAGEPAAADAAWRALGEAALASGAFPLALPARLLERDAALRAPRHVFVPLGNPKRPNDGAWETLTPAWPAEPAALQREMLCVDGGIANNEPIELCREALLLAPGGRLERDPAAATQAMIMVDPFPDEVLPQRRGVDTPFAKLAAALVTAFKNQARYRPADLILAVQGGAFSRQLIAPSSDAKDRPALAGGALGGFFGFVHRRYREHDFLLGRHNCRNFLQKHFAVPVKNPVVAGWALDPATGGPTPLALTVMEEHGLPRERGVVPLIWLPPHLRRSASQDPVPEGAWPVGAFEPDLLRKPLAARLARVLRRLARRRGRLAGAAASLFGGIAARLAAGRIAAILRNARDTGGLRPDIARNRPDTG